MGEFGQRHQTVLVALAAADMDLHALPVDVAHLQRQRFVQTQPHRIGGQQKDPVK